jgi:hypothetical protein
LHISQHYSYLKLLSTFTFEYYNIYNLLTSTICTIHIGVHYYGLKPYIIMTITHIYNILTNNSNIMTTQYKLLYLQ